MIKKLIIMCTIIMLGLSTIGVAFADDMAAAKPVVKQDKKEMKKEKKEKKKEEHKKMKEEKKDEMKKAAS